MEVSYVIIVGIGLYLTVLQITLFSPDLCMFLHEQFFTWKNKEPDNLSLRLKESVIRNILHVKQDQLDVPYMTTSSGSFTRRELAKEIEDETEVGIEMINNMINLTIHLLERKKEEI